MMNDRFSAELRQHLLSVADERPGDGRLAAIVEGVAATGQSNPLVARLPWAPGRTNRLPSPAMRYGLIAAALIVAVVGAAMFAAGQAHRTPFEGTWTSIDPGDGSTETLVIGGGSSPTVRFEDQIATGGACVNDPIKLFTADGTGTISGNHLDTSFADGGGCGSMTVEVHLQFVYDEGTDSLRDQDGVDWIRARSDRPAVPSPTAEPSESLPAGPTPHPGESTFTSAINGFAMGVPAGWKTRAATEPWKGEPLDFDSPAADVIFDPATKDGLYLIVASEAFGDISGDAWRASVLQWTCAGDGGHEFWGWKVDGVHSEQFGPCNSGSIVQTDTRGYMFRLVSPRAERLGLADTWDALKPMLETVDLRPDDAIDPAGSAAALPTCSEISPGTTYTNRFGSPKLAATIPVGATDAWQGRRDVFELGGRCPGGIGITAAMRDAVGGDPCDPVGEGGPARTAREAAAKIAAQVSHRTSEPSTVTIDGREALRLELSTEGNTCTEPWGVWPGTEVQPGQDGIIYLVDVDKEHLLAIDVWYTRGDVSRVELAEAESIVKSIKLAS